MMKRSLKPLWPAVLITALLLSVAGCTARPTEETIPETGSESGTVQANGITIAYESFGPEDGETVLLIAGTGQQLIDWPNELIEELVQRGYRVVIFDNRDTGLSTHLDQAGYPDLAAITEALENGQPAPIPYTLLDMAEDSVGLLDALGIQKAHIVGVSMGGAIAQLVAIHHPDRTLSLSSIMTNSGNPALPVVAKPEAFADVPPMPPEDDVDAYIEYQVKTWQALDSPGYPMDEDTIRELVQRDVERAYDPAGLVRHQIVSLVGQLQSTGDRLENLKNIQAPSVVLHGAEDPLVTVEAAREIAAKIPEAELIIVPGMGHNLPVELTQTFTDAIDKAAQRASSPT